MRYKLTMAASQQCIRSHGSDICPYHPDLKVQLECENCSPGTLVCSLCVATHHRGHVFRDIKAAVVEKTDNIISLIQKTKQETLPELVRELNITTRKLEENKQEYQDEIEQVKKHGENLKLEVDLNTATKVSRLEFLLTENKEILGKHQTIIEKLQSQLRKDITECEKALQTGTKILVYDTEAQFTSSLSITVPSMPTVTICTFTPCTDVRPHLNAAFGDVYECNTDKPGAIPGTKNAAKTPSSIVSSLSINSFIDPPKTLYEHELSYTIWNNCICPTTNNMTWTSGGGDNKLHLVDSRGVERKIVPIDVIFESMCMDRTTQELYCRCSKDRSVRRVNTDTRETTVVFKTNDKPDNIACMDSDMMVMSTRDDFGVNRVCLYTMKGQLLNSYICKGRYAPNVSVCPITNYIAVLGGSGGVTVLNISLQKVYSYRGKGRDHRKHGEDFICYTAVFVDKYLLVGDRLNKMIHMLTASTGDFVRIIQTDSMSWVNALGVQQDGVLWVGCCRPDRLLCVKYCE